MENSPTFRTAPEPPAADTIKQVVPFEPNKQAADYDTKDIEPVESIGQATLAALGIGDDLATLPEAEKANVSELSQYIEDSLKAKGVLPTASAFKRTLENLKEQIGLDPNAMSEVILDKLGGVVRAWKSLAFIEDPKERRNLFYKLARTQSSKEMNDLVYKAMEDKRVWQT